MTNRQGRIAWGVGVGVFLLVILGLHLLTALLAAAGAYVLYRRLWHLFAPLKHPHLKALLALALTIFLLAVLVLLMAALVRGWWEPHGGLPGLLQVLADALERWRTILPPWITEHLPESADDIQQVGAQWMREHAAELQHLGREALRITAELFIGFAVGLMAAFRPGPVLRQHWAVGLRAPLRNFIAAFAGVISAQLRIAAANAIFTGIFLLAALPAFGIHLPAARALVLFTFFMGLVPIVGNLISNAAILLVSSTVSAGVALAALVFLIVIHKLEYVLNAHFVGRSTQVAAPVLLASMLVFEAAFGVGGLLAAPIYVAWLFREMEDIDGEATGIGFDG